MLAVNWSEHPCRFENGDYHIIYFLTSGPPSFLHPQENNCKIQAIIPSVRGNVKCIYLTIKAKSMAARSAMRNASRGMPSSDDSGWARARPWGGSCLGPSCLGRLEPGSSDSVPSRSRSFSSLSRRFSAFFSFFRRFSSFLATDGSCLQAPEGPLIGHKLEKRTSKEI